MAQGRAYDRELSERGAHLGYRIDEPVPVCWVCPTTTNPRSDEHVFPRWLLDRLDAAGCEVEMHHLSASGQRMSARGPMTGLFKIDMAAGGDGHADRTIAIGMCALALGKRSVSSSTSTRLRLYGSIYDDRPPPSLDDLRMGVRPRTVGWGDVQR